MALSFLRTVALAWRLHLARTKGWYAGILTALAIAITLFWELFLSAPSGFPTGEVITIVPGTTITRASVLLSQDRVIASPFLFKALAKFMPGAHGVQSGRYEFQKPAGTLAVAWNLTHGVSGLPMARVTLPEGTTSRQMGKALAAAIPGFDAAAFDALAAPREGYLFPDTYYFLPDTTEQQALAALEANYASHIAAYESRIAASGHSEQDIVTMASLLEGEGKTPEDKRIIAGILWRRLAIGMPLQVDAPFGYVHGISGYAPTAADLASPSPYNTYRRKGLPPTPIDNPGTVSIEAALSPEETGYLYYLTGTDGRMHYAKTFVEHIANQKAYLR